MNKKIFRQRIVPSGWVLKRIGDVAETGSGGTPLSTEIRYYLNGNIPWINSGEVGQNKITSTKNYITDLGVENSSAKLYPKGSVLLAMYGATAGRASILDFEATTNQAICAIILKKGYSNWFVKYYLDLLYHYMVGISSGSARDNLNQKGIQDIEIPFPEYDVQNKITAVLSSLDSKIELNNRINAELEAMAKTLYDYWFVQFDFPDKNGKPYKTSGGKMVWNKELKREIPEGWEVKKIKDLAKTGSGGTPLSTKKEYYENGNIPWINSGEVNSSFIIEAKNFITEDGLNNSSAKIYPKGTILMAMYGATAGQVSLMNIDACTNQAICAIIPNDQKITHYLKFALHQLYQYLINLSSGSARDNLSQEKIKELLFAIPEEIILQRYFDLTNQYFDKILINLKENQKLTELRDWLLPMLMNGQVKVD